MLQHSEDFDMYTAKKDEYIIKPIDGYASHGVYAGQDFTQDQWVGLLKEKSTQNYIIQEYCTPALSENVIYENQTAKPLIVGNLTGLFVYNQKFAGLYSRAGSNPIISGQHNGYTVSSVYINSY